MKLKNLSIFTVFALLLSLSGVAKADDGQMFLRNCTTAMNMSDIKNPTIKDNIDSMQCYGFVQGAVAMNTVYRSITNDTALFCEPKTMPITELTNKVYKFMQENPDKVGGTAIAIVTMALYDEYPCSNSAK